MKKLKQVAILEYRRLFMTTVVTSIVISGKGELQSHEILFKYLLLL